MSYDVTQPTGQGKTSRAKKAQAASGAIFAIFVALHLLNTAMAAVSPAAYDGMQGWLRQIYQFAPIEALILSALLIHIAVGLFRIYSEPKRHLNLRAKLHRYAGFFLLFFIGGHITAVRGASWFYDVYPGFAGLAFTVDAVPLYFYPYYFLLGLTGFYHGFNGLSIALTRLGPRFRLNNNALRYSTGVAGLILISALLGLGGWLFDIDDPYKSGFAKLAIEFMENM